MVSSNENQNDTESAGEEKPISPIPQICEGRSGKDSYFQKTRKKNDVVVVFDHDITNEVKFDRRTQRCNFFSCHFPWVFPVCSSLLTTGIIYIYFIWGMIMFLFSLVFLVVFPVTLICVRYRNGRSLATARHTALCRDGVLVIVDKHKRRCCRSFKATEDLIPFNAFDDCYRAEPENSHVCCCEVEPRDLNDCVLTRNGSDICVVKSLKHPNDFIDCVMAMKKLHTKSNEKSVSDQC